MSLAAPAQPAVDAAPLRVAVAAAQFNAELVDALLGRVLDRLRSAGVPADQLTVERVPGSHELPVAAQLLVGARQPDVVVALGVIIRGDTLHYQLVADAATTGLMNVALGSGVPVINGVVVAETPDQARARCLGEIDRGAEFADAALAMGALRRRLAP